MPGTILVREALRRVCVHLQDIDPQFTAFKERTLVDALNDAHMAIAILLPSAVSRVDAIKLRPGALQSIESVAAADCKPGDGSTPSGTLLGISLLGVHGNMGSDGLTPGEPIRVTSREKLDAQDPTWRAPERASTRIRAYVHDPATPMYFEVWPPVHSVTPVWVRMGWVVQPPKIPNTGTEGGGELYLASGASTETIKVRDTCLDELVFYTCARAHMSDSEAADPGKANYFAGAWMGMMNAKVEAATGVNPNLKRLPFAPAPLGTAS